MQMGLWGDGIAELNVGGFAETFLQRDEEACVPDMWYALRIDRFADGGIVCCF